ncbi:hypothetical protein [Viridibacillus arvi]|uniref:Uncharacterized protein n=1 Tax=Viridibacillus arvi TaxID=263475 RepID=A0A0M0LJJ1_9BACL|nr:hypothetical protein [Viridibacillus arvi]KOO51062.1 hypothetical protein AMD00_00675 [Viridibacillus arvi]
MGYAPITGGSSDKVQVNIRYDINKKFTYLDTAGKYQLGAVTERLYIHFVDTYMYFNTSQGGKSTTHKNYLYNTYTTPNDAEPWKKALYWAGDPWSEYLNVTIYGKPFYF